MRRETRDEVLRNFLAINAMLRDELRVLRRLARDAETKRNPNWALQPRAPRGTPQGGQWTSGGSNQQAPTRSPVARLATPRQGPSPAPGLLLMRRLSPLALATMLTGDTQQPVEAAYFVPGTDNLIIRHRYVPQTGEHSASFERIVTPGPRVPAFTIFGLRSSIETTLPRGFVRLDVSASVDGDYVTFDPRALARAYGREIPGVTSGAAAPRPELVPTTPEEQLLVHNMRALGASEAQILVSLQNLRGRPSDEADEAFVAAMRRSGARPSQIGDFYFELSRARRALRQRTRNLGHNRPPPDILADIFPGLANAAPNSIVLPLPGALEGPAIDYTSTSEVRNIAQGVIRDIREIDPNFSVAQLGSFQETSEGRREFLEMLRLQRAAAIYRTRGEAGPLQLEALLFIQRRVNNAYEEAIQLADAGKLRHGFSRGQAIGNHIDKRVRDELRLLYNHLRIPITGNSRVSVNRRRYSRTRPATDFRIPDSAVGDVIFEVSVEAKSPDDEQISAFFNSAFGPTVVIIVRPGGQTYLITAPRG
jgi:hypothetical protein